MLPIPDYSSSLQHSTVSPLAWYQSLQKNANFTTDPSQYAVMQRLEELYQTFIAYKEAQRNIVKKWFLRPHPPKGIYLYGGVGRGKSFSMDTFFACIPYQDKRRVHFHAFMQEAHEALKQLNNEPDPLLKVAEQIAQSTSLLCFDEFHVSDIADAMILGRLLKALFDRSVVLVMTSNYAPDALYPNGLQRINFLPTIDLIQSQLEVIALNGPVDYRLQMLTRARTWLSPIDLTTNETLQHLFNQLSHHQDLPNTLIINHRPLQSIRHTEGIVWFSFDELCKTARSQIDYLELARHYHTLFLSDIPVLHEEDANAARRFTWLIDILYNARVKLIASSDTTSDLLYPEGKKADEFARTRSRLEEMQSKAYLELTHLP